MKRRVFKRSLASFIAAVAVFTLGASAVESQQSGDPARGKTNFMSYGCYECHGTAGQGNFFGGPKLAPHTLPLAALLRYIRSPAGVMPAYSANILTDQKATEIWSYLSSLPDAKPVGSIPALSAVTSKPR